MFAETGYFTVSIIQVANSTAALLAHENSMVQEMQWGRFGCGMRSNSAHLMIAHELFVTRVSSHDRRVAERAAPAHLMLRYASCRGLDVIGRRSNLGCTPATFIAYAVANLAAEPSPAQVCRSLCKMRERCDADCGFGAERASELR